MTAPVEYVFLAGDPVPEWIERVVVEPEWAGRAWLTFSVHAEADRYADRVVVRPLFPPTRESPDLMRLDTDGYVAGTVHIHGAPTHVHMGSRYFPNPPIEWDDDDEDGQSWDALNGETPR